MAWTRACQDEQRLSKSTFLALLGESKAYEFYSSIPDASWSIMSFNPRLREVCVLVTAADGGVQTLTSVTLPQTVPQGF